MAQNEDGHQLQIEAVRQSLFKHHSDLWHGDSAGAQTLVRHHRIVEIIITQPVGIFLRTSELKFFSILSCVFLRPIKVNAICVETVKKQSV